MNLSRSPYKVFRPHLEVKGLRKSMHTFNCVSVDSIVSWEMRISIQLFFFLVGAECKSLDGGCSFCHPGTECADRASRVTLPSHSAAPLCEERFGYSLALGLRKDIGFSSTYMLNEVAWLRDGNTVLTLLGCEDFLIFRRANCLCQLSGPLPHTNTRCPWLQCIWMSKWRC